MATYLANTFSPSMLAPGTVATVRECTLTEIPENAVSIVSHELTAAHFSVLLGRHIAFNRVNVTLKPGDTLFAILLQFRPETSREFTREEIEKAGVRVFRVDVLAGNQ
ncbi:MAG: DUF1874 domain-containing protein [Gemmatales bacterium]|nr:YddF family protein [Gemmatales bacterium]MDW8175112.1 DUF1874 domain-containing protein [Gemmatales bacterium]